MLFVLLNKPSYSSREKIEFKIKTSKIRQLVNMVQTRSQVQGKVYVNENDEMEIKVWELRNEMVGMKNVNMSKKEKITKKIMKVLGELEAIEDKVMATEVMMDLLKFQWKFVLKGLMNLEDFRNEFDHVCEHFDCECGECIQFQVQVIQFKQDIENLMTNFNKCSFNQKYDKVIYELNEKFEYKEWDGQVCEWLAVDIESILPSDIGMKAGKYTLLPSDPKTKYDHVMLIKYDIMKAEQTKSGSKQRVFWSLKAIEDGYNFVMNCDEVKGLFKETIIRKMKEIKENDLVNEHQKARIELLLEQLEPKVNTQVTGNFLTYKALESTETDNESEVLDCNCACHLIQSNGVCGEVPVSCILYPVSCILYPVSCITKN